MHNKNRILLVDDDDIIIDTTEIILSGEGYDYVSTTNGSHALSIISEQKFDLVLLDVMMPGIDGFQVCKALKNDAKTKNIPVLMVTSLSENTHRIMAMEAGADDFISKPIDQTELLIRIKSLLRLKSYSDELIESYDQLCEKNQRLEQLEKLKDDLTHMIVHDLKGPLNAIVVSIELVLDEQQGFTNYQLGLLNDTSKYCQDLQGMIDDILVISKLEEGKMLLNVAPSSLAELTKHTMESFKRDAIERKLSMELHDQSELHKLQFDPALVRRVLFNLVDNATRHTPLGGTIDIDIKRLSDRDFVSWSIWNSGKALPDEFHDTVFEKYEQISQQKAGLFPGKCGLGLPFCKMAIEAHQGEITVESKEVAEGTRFTFTLPLMPDSARMISR